MRKLLTAAAAIFAAALSVSAQDVPSWPEQPFWRFRVHTEEEDTSETEDIDIYHNFRIAYGRFAVWQKTYDSNFSSAEKIARCLFEKGLFTNIKVVDDSTVTCRYCWTGQFPYKALGIRYGQLPIFLVNANMLKTRLVFQIKGKYYRVTADNLHIVNNGGTLDSYGDVFVNDEGEFIKSKTLSVACRITDAMLQDAVDFSKPGYLAPDF